MTKKVYIHVSPSFATLNKEQVNYGETTFTSYHIEADSLEFLTEIGNTRLKTPVKISLTEAQYDALMKLIKKDERENARFFLKGKLEVIVGVSDS
jgi:hypothetical protein